VPRPINFNDRTLLVGKTQSGKTTFARMLFAGFTGARRVLVNVKGRVDVGVAPTRSVDAIDWTAPVVNFIPPTMDIAPDELAARIRALRVELGDYAFLWYSRADDELVNCAPLDPGWGTYTIPVPEGAQVDEDAGELV
jgi:hypothetical protein